MVQGRPGDLPPWCVPVAEPERARALGRAIGVRPLTAQILLNRRVVEPSDALRFLAPRLSDLRPPDGGKAGQAQAMAGFDRAAERLARALTDGETVGVFGDYDVDGVTTCALLSRFLLDAGGRVVPRVARRDAGYGFGVPDADGFADAGCKVVVTGDCGTSDHEAIARAGARGIDVIVVDHHQVPERETGAFALLNPHQPGCGFPFKGMASVGVGFYLAAAVRTRLRALGREAPDPRDLLDLVAVGTIADLAPLTDENRVLVSAGLKELARGRRPGLKTLLESAGVETGRPLTSADISFKIAPRLNAPGRLGDAGLALDLLLAPDVATAVRCAAAIEEINARRRVVSEQVFAEAVAQIEAAPVASRAAVVVAGQGWAPGVVGIVAARLVDRYGCPSVVIALNGGVGRGSARTTPGLHLYRALLCCAAHLVRFGGHAAAAGLTIEERSLPEFIRAFQAAALVELGESAPRAGLPVDAEVDLHQIDEVQAEEMARLGPFGIGNPEPLLAARGLLDHSRIVGEKHLQITLRDGPHARDGIAFGLAGRDPGRGARVRVAFVAEMDHYRGARRLRLRVRDFTSDGKD
ncbi:MAG: single-stranded-DNA-specific exonuclease RecJ [Myxococcales bacterium]|nr:single-stranded-DNA-specific exonuclease RecJ [Myxococcales bacterium]